MCNKSLERIGIATVACIVLLLGCGKAVEVEFDSPKANVENSIKPTLKVFLENSGSMDGYMCEGSNLKEAVFDYLSDLNGLVSKVELNYINSTVIPFSGSLEKYIKTLNPTTFKLAGGNRSNSDLAKMISTVLDSVSDSTVCIFISDCILALPAQNSQKHLSTCRIGIKNKINEIRKENRLQQLGVEILKLSSDFNGKYFYQKGGIEMLKGVKRPYYIWIFGTGQALAEFNSKVPISNLEKYGFEDMVSFANKTDVSFDIGNRTVSSNVITPTKGDYYLTLRANFTPTLQGERVIQNSKNYSFVNPKIRLENISPITAKNSPYTHCITFVIPKGVNVAQECLTFCAAELPEWVDKTNDTSDVDILNNLSKTIGIKSLIEGVADAYKNETVLTNFTFKIKRK